MTLLELYNYFEDYAIKHRQLAHGPGNDADRAFGATIAESDAAEEFIKSCERELIMVLIPDDKRLAAAGGESYNWSKSVTFLLLKKLSRPSAKEIIEAQSLCEEIGEDFFTRVIADRTTAFPTVDLNSFYMKPVGPISDDRYGQICMFTMTANFEHWVHDDHWIA